MRGFGAAQHYLGVESKVTSFAGETTAIRASAAVSVTDAICRIPKLRGAFTVEAELMRQRLQQLEAAGEPVGRRVARRMIGWFWCGLFLGCSVAFAAGYLVGHHS